MIHIFCAVCRKIRSKLLFLSINMFNFVLRKKNSYNPNDDNVVAKTAFGTPLSSITHTHKMKKSFKFLLTTVVALCSFGVANAQSNTSSDPMAYLNSTYPQLTELFNEELSSYPAHYIFAVDVSGTMNKYEPLVVGALDPFFKALPDNDRVDVIPFGNEAKTSVLGYSGVIDRGVRESLCSNIRTLYKNESYTKEFKQYTDIQGAVDGITKVIQNNQEYKVIIVVIVTDFRNDQQGLGECKLTKDNLKSMKNSIKAATDGAYTRFIALELPVDRDKPGYCLNQLHDDVFSFDGHTLEIASTGNDKELIRQWFEQLKREIMVTKLKAIVHDANKNTDVDLNIKRDIDGNVTAEISWVPSKLYPTIKIDETTMGGDYYFINNKENFMETAKSPINVELGQIKHNEWGFHTMSEDVNLGLMFPVPYDNELAKLEAEKPIPSTTIKEEGLLFTFFWPLWVTALIAGLIILYIILVFKAIKRNNACFLVANIYVSDRNGTPLGDMIQITKAKHVTSLTIGRSGSNGCDVDNADWQISIVKKNGNPLLVFQKPTFMWRQSAGSVRKGTNTSGELSGSLAVVCGESVTAPTHMITVQRIIPKK